MAQEAFTLYLTLNSCAKLGAEVCTSFHIAGAV